MYKSVKSLLLHLSPLDYGVIFIIILISAYSIFTLTRKKDWIYIELVSFPQEWSENSFPPQYWETAGIERADTVYSVLGQKIAEVIEITKNEWGGKRKTVRLTIKIQAVYNPRTRLYSFEESALVVGRKLTLNIDRTLFVGEVRRVYKTKGEKNQGYEAKTASVTVLFRNYDIWHAEALKNFTVLNSAGMVVLKTIRYEDQPAEMIVTTDDGQVFIRQNPQRRDVELEMELNDVLCYENVCYFNDELPIKIGATFWAQSERTFVSDGSIKAFTIH